MKKKISIITPVYNESENIDVYYNTMAKSLDDLSDKFDFEIILTDNCSIDDTFEKASRIADCDPRVHVIRFSRNYGYQLSILTGYKYATGDAAIEFDCDLQDPPELLGTFIEAWEAGAQIVYGVRRTRKEGTVIQFLRKSYYRILRAIADHDLPVDSGDFMLLDRKVLDVLKAIEDPDVYIRGVVFSLGFNRTPVSYDRAQREHGVSKFSLAKLLQLAFDGFFSQSSLPLKISGYAALFLWILTALTLPVYAVLKVVTGTDWPPGFATLISFLLFQTGMNAFFFYILGSYLLRLYRQTQFHGRVIVNEYVGRAPPDQS